MTIPVTTRGGKGFPLTETEMDDNFTDLARNATTSVQGNVQLTDSIISSSTTTAATPNSVSDVQDNVDAIGYTITDLHTGATTGAVTLSSPYTGFDLIGVECSFGTQFGWMWLPSSSIVIDRRYTLELEIGGGDNDGALFAFSTTTAMDTEFGSIVTVVGVKTTGA